MQPRIARYIPISKVVLLGLITLLALSLSFSQALNSQDVHTKLHSHILSSGGEKENSSSYTISELAIGEPITGMLQGANFNLDVGYIYTGLQGQGLVDSPTLEPITTPTNQTPQLISGTKTAYTSIWLNGYLIVELSPEIIWSYSLDLQEGENWLIITAKDIYDNESESITDCIILDSTPPAIPTLDPVTSPTNIATQLLTGSKEINSSILIDGITKVSLNPQTTWSTTVSLTEGLNSFSITSEDALGNESQAVTAEILLDTQLPQAPTVNPVSSPTNQTTQDLSGTKEANTSVWINDIERIPLNPAAIWSAEVSLNEGENIFDVTTKDEALNESPPTQTSIFLDTTAPTTPIITDDGIYTTSTTQLHASWTSEDPQTGIIEYQYAIGTASEATDIVNWTSIGTQTEVTHTGLSLNQGQSYYILVQAKNGAGTWSSIGASDGITVNQNPPVISTISPSDGSGFHPETIITISTTANDPDADSLQYQFSIDGQVRQSWSGVSTYDWHIFSTDIGLHAIKAEVTDNLGGLDTKSVEVYIFLQPMGLPVQ